MDLTSIEISAAGMRAQRARMDAIAANLANQDTTSVRVEGGAHVPYRRRITMLLEGRDGAPVARVVEDPSEFRTERRPGHPHAGPDGLLRLPNVDPMVETTALMAASRAYEANVTAAEVAKAMNQSSLRILG